MKLWTYYLIPSCLQETQMCLSLWEAVHWKVRISLLQIRWWHQVMNHWQFSAFALSCLQIFWLHFLSFSFNRYLSVSHYSLVYTEIYCIPVLKLQLRIQNCDACPTDNCEIRCYLDYYGSPEQVNQTYSAVSEETAQQKWQGETRRAGRRNSLSERVLSAEGTT